MNMWEEQSEFEQALASYWEDEADRDARTLTSDPAKTPPIIRAQSAAARLFKKIHQGVSHVDRHGRHVA
jgi:hypothetical protein